MSTTGGSRKNLIPNDDGHLFNPMLYNFRVSPKCGSDKEFTLQQPFATLFDNLITVLWSVFNKKTNIQIGVNQLQWALEFMRVMKTDYGYSLTMQYVVIELEDLLISLYAKIGQKMVENINMSKKEQEVGKAEKNKNSKNSTAENPIPVVITSFNEEDIMGKLKKIKMIIDPASGEPTFLKDLNSMGKRKKNKDDCKDNKQTIIGKLQKILNKTMEEETRTGIQEILKELKVETLAVKMAT